MPQYGARSTMRYTSPEVNLYDALIDIDVDHDLSEAVDLGTDTLIGLVLPANYDTAAITFFNLPAGKGQEVYNLVAGGLAAMDVAAFTQMLYRLG
jgi:hypothetical protein